MAKTIPLLHYEIHGSGPTVVLLHGFMSSLKYWSEVIEDLSQSHRVVAIDLLGFGESPKPRCSKYDLDAQLVSVRAVLKHLGLNNFILAGHSMGSLISLRYATLYPDEVSKLLLVNIPVFANDTEAKNDIYGHSLLYRLGLRPGLHGLIWPIVKISLRVRFAKQKMADDLNMHKQYMFQSSGISRIRSLRNLIFKAHVENDLHNISMKTTILAGVQDRAAYLRNLATYRLSNNVSVRKLVDGHHAPRTQPGLVAELVRAG